MPPGRFLLQTVEDRDSLASRSPALFRFLQHSREKSQRQIAGECASGAGSSRTGYPAVVPARETVRPRRRLRPSRPWRRGKAVQARRSEARQGRRRSGGWTWVSRADGLPDTDRGACSIAGPYRSSHPKRSLPRHKESRRNSRFPHCFSIKKTADSLTEDRKRRNPDQKSRRNSRKPRVWS